MLPLLIDEHAKKLIWPDDLDAPDQACVRLTNIADDTGDDHIIILEDVDGMARLYLRHVPSDEISANVPARIRFHRS